MPRTVKATLAVAFVGIAALPGCGERRASAVTPDSPPNVLVICIDALRADRLGIHGAAPSPSPALDELAATGIAFTDATSVASWTKPAVPSLLTGLYPDEHGVFDNNRSHVDTLSPVHPTLAGMLREKGYRTAAFVENDQLEGPVSGLDREFSLYVDEAGRPAEIADRFLNWSVRQPHLPWFAYLHIFDPHYPYEPDDFLFDEAESARLRMRIAHWELRGEFWWLLRDRVNEKTMQLDELALNDLHRLYRLEIEEVDAVLGRMLDALAKDGTLDRTLVIVTADHGEGFLERGRIDHGYGPYRELLHIPLIVRLPGRARAGTRSNLLAQNVDIPATVLDLLDLPIPPAWSSRSLLAMLDDPSKARRVALAQERHGHSRQTSARDARFSYVRSEMTAGPARGRVLPPPSAMEAVRVRAHGIFDGSRFVAGSVKHIAPGDPDLELDGPVESVDAASGSLRVLGTSVTMPTGGPDDAAAVSGLQVGQHVRVHGTIERGSFLAAKIERTNSRTIEIEGVIRSVEVLENGDATIDLGGMSFLVDPQARWTDFPDSATGPGERSGRAVAPAVHVVEELFDRSNDPAELHDVAGGRPAELETMRLLAQQAEDVLLRPSHSGRASIDAPTRERLRAMGYVE